MTIGDARKSQDEPDWLNETVKTLNNLCLITFVLIDTDRRELLPTVLELMHLETQELIDKYCVVR